MKEDKLNVLILFGGTSPEHEVSRNSAASVAENIDRDKYNVFTVGITKNGEWFLTTASSEEMGDGSWEFLPSNRKAVISPDRLVHGLDMGDRQQKIDVVFPVFHGECGEDGTIQGLLTIAGIPFVGAGVASSACSMDKTVTKVLVEKAGIRQAKYFATDRITFSQSPLEVIASIEEKFDGKYPLFVKPAGTGSSVGISKAKNKQELFDGIRYALEKDFKILVEETIVGREFEVAVIGNRDPQASPVGEVISGNEFYDYEAKYSTTQSSTRMVDDVPKEKLDEFRSAAIVVYKAMGCRGMSRVDFFLTEKTELVFNELNTIPGFTKTSMYPKMWASAGLEYRELITKLLELAMEEL